MKLMTFDRSKINDYMKNSSVLEQGIKYMKSIRPDISDSVAEATAISQAQDFCYQKWLNDRTGYIDSEWKAFSEFKSDVQAGRYFSTKNADKKKAAQESAKEFQQKQIENERKRVLELKEFCEKNNLDFNTENIKQLKKIRFKHKLSNFIMTIAFFPGAIALFILVFMELSLIWGAILLAALIVFIIGLQITPPYLPDSAYDPLKNKK